MFYGNKTIATTNIV